MSNSIPKDFDFALKGYDILKIDPLSLGSADPQSQENVFEICGDDFPPNGWNHRTNNDGKLESQTRVISSLFEFQFEMGETISGNLNLGPFAFSRSTSYEESRTEKVGSEMTSTFCYGVQTYDTYNIRQSNPLPKLTDNFNRDVSSLPSKEGDKYQQFVAKWGTHYMSEATFGGRRFQQSFMKKSTYESLVREGFSVSDGASASYEYDALIHVGGGAESSDRRETRERFERAVGSGKKDVRVNGGTISEDFDNWSKTIEANPVVIQFKIAYLSDLLTTSHFPGDSEIETKKHLLANAISTYIRQKGASDSTGIVKYYDGISVITWANDTSYALASGQGKAIISNSKANLTTNLQYWRIRNVTGESGEIRIGDTVFIMSAIAQNGLFLAHNGGYKKHTKQAPPRGGYNRTFNFKAAQADPSIQWDVVSQSDAVRQPQPRVGVPIRDNEAVAFVVPGTSRALGRSNGATDVQNFLPAPDQLWFIGQNQNVIKKHQPSYPSIPIHPNLGNIMHDIPMGGQ